MLSAQGVEVEWLAEALHDLCQPLTALQCRLFLATMADSGERAAEMEDAVRAGLQQCERTITLVRAMQQRMQRDEEAA